MKLEVLPLTREAFRPYGDVIETEGHDFFHINDAHTERYHALVETEIEGEAKAGISIFRNIKASVLPMEISMLERHPKGSQAFIPLQQQKFLIIVAPALDKNTPDISKLCAFVSDGKQSINYRAGTWHHPLLTFEAPSDFAVVDRIGGGANCDIFQFPHPIKITV